MRPQCLINELFGRKTGQTVDISIQKYNYKQRTLEGNIMKNIDQNDRTLGRQERQRHSSEN